MTNMKKISLASPRLSCLFRSAQFSSAALLTIGLATGCTFQVDSFQDLPDADASDFVCDTGTGVCTLRAAVMQASVLGSFDTILVPAGIYNLTLPANSSGGRLVISNNVTVQGSGKDNTIVNQTVNDAVIEITGGEVALNNLTIQGGNSQGGGGVRIGNAIVHITDAVIQENFGFTGGGGLLVEAGGDVRLRRLSVRDNGATGAFGGGIWNQGTLWVYESEITDNYSNRAGGIRNSGNLNLRNVTVSGNYVNSPEAGVGGISQNGFAVLNNVTVNNNTGSGNNAGSFRGGGIQMTAGATTVIKNSVIAGNDGGTGPDDCVGTLSGDSKYNLIGSTEACTIPSFVFTFILDQSANLGSLALNGGPTGNHLPNTGSPARDSGYQYPPPAIDACESHDQRGVPRPQGAGQCDMGAVEYTAANHFVTGFVLINAMTNTDIRPLLYGDALDLSALPPELSVRALITSAPGSVVFDFDAAKSFQIENNAPWALDGDANGDYIPVAFSAGEHSIRATPFTLANGAGAAGGSWSIRFSVIE